MRVETTSIKALKDSLFNLAPPTPVAEGLPASSVNLSYLSSR